MSSKLSPMNNNKTNVYMNIVVALSDESLSRFEEIKQELTQEGFSIQHSFEYGVIIGTANEETLQKIRKHPDVISAELELIAKII